MMNWDENERTDAASAHAVVHHQSRGTGRIVDGLGRNVVQRIQCAGQYSIRQFTLQRHFQHFVRPFLPPCHAVLTDCNDNRAHYDISNSMFESFLSADMTYSCALFGPLEGGPTGDLYPHLRVHPAIEGVDELEQAQMRKLRLIIERARIGKGDRVLEIGSGWGSFAIEVPFPSILLTACDTDTIRYDNDRPFVQPVVQSIPSPSPSSKNVSPNPVSPPPVSPPPSPCTS